MKTYRIDATITSKHKLTIDKLPFDEGDQVEVIIRKREHTNRYPLRGKPYRYDDPFGSVADDEWEALK